MAIVTQEQDLLRGQFHHSRIYASFLKPLTLWTARVNDATIGREEIEIIFDGGAGLDWGAVEALQTLWVGTSAGAMDVGKVRIRAKNSATAGATGTITVAANPLVWADNLYLTFKHNYELDARYPYIDPITEEFYKDRDISFLAEYADEPGPVVVADVLNPADFVRNGELFYEFSLARSYPMTPGATLTSFACSVYPLIGVAVTIDAGTGIGFIRITSVTQDYYWAKFTVTDSNGHSQSSYRCLFAHDPIRGRPTFPHLHFNLNQTTRAWDRGGCYAQVLLTDDAALSDIPDETYCIIWRLSSYGTRAVSENLVRIHTPSGITYVSPELSYRIYGGPAAGDMDIVFTCGVLLNGLPAPDGTIVNLGFVFTGSTPTSEAAVVADGIVTVTTTVIGGDYSEGEIEVSDDDDSVLILTVPYGPITFPIGHQSAPITDSAYPSPIWVFPQVFIAGYVRKDNLIRNLGRGDNQDTIEITTVEDLLKNHFMYSISLAARPTPGTWYEYGSFLTIGQAAHHIFKWHSTLLEIANVVGLTDNLDGRAYAEFEDGSLYTMPDQMARSAGIRAHLVSTPKGDVTLTADVQLLNNTERNAVPIILELDKEDMSSELALSRQVEPRVALAFLSGLVFDGNFIAAESIGEPDPKPEVFPYCAVAPGVMPARAGEGVVNLEREVIRSQTHANELAGRVLAQTNNPYPELRLKFHGDYDAFLDPAQAEWWQVSIASADTLREIVLTDLRLLLRSVSSFFQQGHVWSEVVFEPEAQGINGLPGNCMDTLPEPPGDDPAPDPEGLPGALATASSVHLLLPGTSAWDLRTAQNTSDMIADPFWRERQATNASSQAIMLRSGIGYIKRTTDAWDTETVITPATNPPNDAADSPAPLVGDVDFRILDGSYINQGEFMAIATWQNVADEWRSWLVYTDDDGATWAWESIPGGGGSSPDYGTTAQFEPDYTQFDTAVGGFSYRSAAKNVAKLSGNKFVIAWVEVDAVAIPLSIKVICGTVSAGVITYGTEVEVYEVPVDHAIYRLKIVGIHEEAFLLGWMEEDDVGNRVGYMTTGNVLSGTIVTMTAIQSFNSNFPANWNVARVDDSTGVLVYNDNVTVTGYYAFVGVPASGAHTVGSSSVFEATFEPQAIDACGLTDSKIVIVYILDNGSDIELWCVCVDGGVGTPVMIDSTVDPLGYQDVAIDWLTNAKFVVAYRDASDGDHGKAVVGTVSGTTITLGTITDYEGGTISNPTGNSLTRLSDTRFVTAYAHDNAAWSRINSVSGTTITVGAENADVDTATNRPNDYSVVALSGSRWVTAYPEKGSQGQDGQAFVVDLAGYETMALDLCIDRQIGDFFWLTLWDGSELAVKIYSLPTLALVRDFGFGSASLAEVEAREKILYVVAPFSVLDTAYVFGRVEIGHIFFSDNAAISFSALETGWGTDHCGGFIPAYAGLFSLRHLGNQAKLYVNGVLRATLPLTAGTRSHGFTIDWRDNTLVAGSDSGETIMVVIASSPYIEWVDLTSDHATSRGIRSVVVL